MTRQPNFGFSAFLKIIHENEKPQRRLIRERYKPSENGYDYHRSLRLRVRWMAKDERSFSDVIKTLTAIKKTAERTSTLNGLRRFADWRERNPGIITFVEPVRYTSTNKLFQVMFAADFVLQIGQRITAVHIWNTQRLLSRELVVSALTLIASCWPAGVDRPDDFAVLCLKTGQLFKWSEHNSRHDALANKLVMQVESNCELARRELALPTLPSAIIGDDARQ